MSHTVEFCFDAPAQTCYCNVTGDQNHRDVDAPLVPAPGAIRIVTNIVSTVTVDPNDPNEIAAFHLIEIDGPDEAPESLLKATARSAAENLKEIVS